MGIGAVVGIDGKDSPGVSPGVVLNSSNDVNNIALNFNILIKLIK